MVKFNKVSFSYDKKKRALDNVTFNTLDKGLVCIVGENGSGKSTLINLISNKIKFSGDVLLSGKSVTDYKNMELAKLISFLPQKLQFPDNITVMDVIAIGRNPYTNMWGKLGKNDKEVMKKYADLMKVHDLYHSQFSELSGGQQQRVFLAMVLVQETPIVVLDEPTNHLDVRYQIEIFNLIEEIKKDRLVLMTTHNLNMSSKYGDQFVFLKKGKLLSVGDSKVITAKNLEKLFGVQANIENLNGKPVIVDMELSNDETEK